MTRMGLQIHLQANGLGLIQVLQAILAIIALSLWLFVPWLWLTATGVQKDIINLEESLTQTRQLHHQFVNQAETSGLSLSPARLKTLVHEVRFAKHLASHQRFSWTQFLNDLEGAVPKNVSMESVALNFKKSAIALSGTTASLKDLANLVKGLEEHEAFNNVIVAGHKTRKKKDNTPDPFPNAVDFSLEVSYQPKTGRSTS